MEQQFAEKITLFISQILKNKILLIVSKKSIYVEIRLDDGSMYIFRTYVAIKYIPECKVFRKYFQFNYLTDVENLGECKKYFPCIF